MVVLVPSITEKALARVTAEGNGSCTMNGITKPCIFTIESSALPLGHWYREPTQGPAEKVSWETYGSSLVIPGPERGNVIYKVSIQGINQPNSSSSAFTFGTVEMYFDNPATVGSANECDQHKTHPMDGAMLTITCTITGGSNGNAYYTVQGQK